MPCAIVAALFTPRRVPRGAAPPRCAQFAEGEALLMYLLAHGSRVPESSMRKGLKKLTDLATLSESLISMVRSAFDVERRARAQLSSALVPQRARDPNPHLFPPPGCFVRRARRCAT